MKKCSLLLLACLMTAGLFAQSKPLTYYLPDIAYDPAIPTPESVLGYQMGDWHISHDQLLAYMRVLDAASDRISLEETGRTYENRPLVLLTITSAKNRNRLDQIKAQRQALCDPSRSSQVNVQDMPVVLYQGYSIHGNEPSGANAAPLVAYYLAAGQSAEIQQLLDNAVILFDPSFNPDGLQRFSTWANSHKNKTLTGDPNDREFNEAWPRGRTNHYWFDLNRDWLPAQHPESRARLKQFHDWKPNVLTDHHEMGTNSSFFFMPGVPSRVHPMTPKLNQELTGKIGAFHAAALDKIGSLYFTKEGYDDFYYGKGSTYPDANGAIGILFEQASSRGHLQESENGLLEFAFTIRNQVTTALSTFKAITSMREELLGYQRDFYKSAITDARADAKKAFVFGEAYDKARLQAFLEMVLRHQIQVYPLARNISAGGKQFAAENSYVIPLEQAQYRLIKGMFEQYTTFEDSLFYDISAWTLPLAFNLPFASLDKAGFNANLLGPVLTATPKLVNPPVPALSRYAYLMEWDNYFAPKALYQILKTGLRTKVAAGAFILNNKTYNEGTIMVPVQNQDMTPEAIQQKMAEIAAATGVTIEATNTGLTPEGIDLGSRYFAALSLPQVMLVVDGGVNSTDAGEVWHLLDTRYEIPLSKVSIDRVGSVDLSRYNVILMPDGSYGELAGAGAENIRSWTQKGGTLVLMERAVQWGKMNNLANVNFKANPAENQKRRPYVKLADDFGSQSLPGAIFQTEVDAGHPLAYGIRYGSLPVFRGNTLFMEPAKNPYATPVLYTQSPLLAGYVPGRNKEGVKGAAAVIACAQGQGRVVCIGDNPAFRAFWYGTNKLLANAIFFGSTISSGSLERGAPPRE